jgi:hypothetical protein
MCRATPSSNATGIAGGTPPELPPDGRRNCRVAAGMRNASAAGGGRDVVGFVNQVSARIAASP